jgi:MFS family permease
MTGTPLAIVDPNVLNSTSRAATTAVELHMIGMFLPSLITGRVVARIGRYKTAFIGNLVASGGAAMYFAYQSVPIYALSICLVGAGWNWVYVAASSCLPLTMQRHNVAPNGRFMAQVSKVLFVLLCLPNMR